MSPDPLAACRARWREAAPLTGDGLRIYRELARQAADSSWAEPIIDRLVAEVLRLREQVDLPITAIAAMRDSLIELRHANDALNRELDHLEHEQWGRELWLACWMVAMRALHDATTGVMIPPRL